MAAQRGGTPPDGGVSVNAPINLNEASRALSRGFNRIYDWRFASQCRDDVLRRQKKGWAPLEIKIPYFATCLQFDDLYTGPVSGFGTGAGYYNACSAAQYLPLIEKPTVMISAMDDPFVPAQDYLNARVSSSTEIWLTNTGGHMGYLEGLQGMFAPGVWLDEALLRAVTLINKG